MKKKLFYLCFFINCLLFADQSLKGLYNFEELPVDEIKAGYGFLEPQYIKDTNYTDCLMFDTENITGINSFLFYPCYSNKKQGQESKIVINDQEFLFDGYLDFPFVKFYTFKYEKQTYLILTQPVGKYYDRMAYILDITNPDKIIFFAPDDRFIENDFGEKFVGLYQDKVCFFFSRNRFDWNLQCELSPYFIGDNSLKRLCDDNGNPYYVNYSYNDRFEQELVIEEKYCK